HFTVTYLANALPSQLSSFILRLPLSSTLFPYTTLFRSGSIRGRYTDVVNRAAVDAPLPDRDAELAGAPDCLPIVGRARIQIVNRSEEHTSELQSPYDLVCRLLLEKKNTRYRRRPAPTRA